jgi:hypothetical protein
MCCETECDIAYIEVDGKSKFKIALSPGVKRPGREVFYSPPTSVEVKKMWIYTSTPIRHHGVVLN